MSDNEKVSRIEMIRRVSAIGMIEPAALKAYFEEKGASTSCMSCGKNDWHIFRPGNEGVAEVVLTPAMADGHPSKIPMHIPTLVLICMNCGFVRQHAALPISLWNLDKRPGQGG